jgi:hypothetical protein
MAWTPGTRSLTPKAVPAWRFVWPLVRLAQKRASAEKAARAPIHLASSVSVAGLNGAYFDGMVRKELPTSVYERELQDRIFELGLELSRRAMPSVRPSAA